MKPQSKSQHKPEQKKQAATPAKGQKSAARAEPAKKNAKPSKSR
jgi:hypothetical protein